MRSLFTQLVVTSGGCNIWWMVYLAVIPFGVTFDLVDHRFGRVLIWFDEMASITFGTACATFGGRVELVIHCFSQQLICLL